MGLLTSTKKRDGSVSNLDMFFAAIFIAIWAILATFFERLGNFKPLATKVQTVPNLMTRLKEQLTLYL